MWKSTSGNLCVALPVGVFAGVFLAGALLFLFEALFPYLTGVLFPLFLEPEVRADLERHTKAQHESYPWHIRWITYSLGLSIKYEVKHAGRAYHNVYESICATDAEFALRTGGIQCIQDSRMPEEARTEKYQKLSIEDILTTAFPKEISRYEMSNYLRRTEGSIKHTARHQGTSRGAGHRACPEM